MKSLICKANEKIIISMAIILGSIAMLIAVTASSTCTCLGFFEPEMPKCLYNNEKE